MMMEAMPQLTESEKDIVFERAIHIVESMSHTQETIQVLVPWRPKGIYVWVELQRIGSLWKESRIIETLHASDLN